ncbi:MAG: indole-3-glycerol phosphate synthase TrpC [Desulfobacteraceae bacterium]|jgi:indole-3-glycerol phosphate synthase|nr:MAG: indole-3-glycerol phosphate synthase TrpC [Desulfobacteraceae bacterium]
MEESLLNNILEIIIQAKHKDVRAARRRIPLNQMRREAEARRDVRPFFSAFNDPGASGVNIIAEIKRASPSKGIIRQDLDPAELAAAYEQGGACAVSVLTEKDHFIGSLEDLKRARAAIDLPVLRKDFLFCDYQLYESAAMGADAVLLIARILDQVLLADLLGLASLLGLAALVEIYGGEDLENATRAGARLIAINNRNLASFKTDLDHTLRIVPLLEPEQVAVAASGIRTRDEIIRYRAAGVYNFLIGESLVRSENPSSFLKMLKGEAG